MSDLIFPEESFNIEGVEIPSWEVLQIVRMVWKYFCRFLSDCKITNFIYILVYGVREFIENDSFVMQLIIFRSKILRWINFSRCDWSSETATCYSPALFKWSFYSGMIIGLLKVFAIGVLKFTGIRIRIKYLGFLKKSLLSSLVFFTPLKILVH